MAISCADVQVGTTFQEIATPLRARNDRGRRWLLLLFFAVGIGGFYRPVGAAGDS